MQELIEDETVTEIAVNGPDAIFWNGPESPVGGKRPLLPEKSWKVIQQIVGKCNRVVNESMPIVGCPSGERSQSECGESARLH